MPPTPDAVGSLDLSDLPENLRLAFYGALFAMAAADRSMDEVETERIYESLDLQHLSPHARKQVLAQAIQPPPLERCLLQLKDTDLEVRRALMLNLIDIVLADDAIEPGEHVSLHHARNVLGLSLDDVSDLHDMAYAVQQGAPGATLQRPIRPLATAAS